jgi:hypothetical protein
VVIALIILGAGISLYVTTGVGVMMHKVVRSVLLDKENSQSYRDRASSSAAAMETASETYYMGAGWGSVRASGLMYVLLGNVGVVGAALFVGFVASLFLPLLRRHPAPTDAATAHLYEKALLALTVMLVGLLAAGAEPVVPVLWALFAVATAGKVQTQPFLPAVSRSMLRPSASYV